MAKVKFKVLVEELDTVKPKYYYLCWKPPLYWCDVMWRMGPV